MILVLPRGLLGLPQLGRSFISEAAGSTKASKIPSVGLRGFVRGDTDFTGTPLPAARVLLHPRDPLGFMELESFRRGIQIQNGCTDVLCMTWDSQRRQLTPLESSIRQPQRRASARLTTYVCTHHLSIPTCHHVKAQAR